MKWMYILFGIIFVILLLGSILFYKKLVKRKSWSKRIICALPLIIYLIVVSIVVVCLNNHLSYVESQVLNQTIALIEDESILNFRENRLLDVVVGYEYDDFNRSYTEDISDYFFKVWGTANTCYWSYYSDFYEEWVFEDEDCSDIYKNGVGYELLSEQQVGRINNALKKHWEKIGL